MKLEAIEQEPIDHNAVMTRVVINEVPSHCLLSRLMVQILGRPGVDNDMEFIGSGTQWVIVWTQPQLTMVETRALMSKVIQSLTPEQ